MKHVSKALLLVLVLILTVAVFASCSSVNGLTKESEALGSPEKVARNKEPYSTTLVPYESVEQALGGDYASSPYYKSLNGTWDFSLVLNPKLMPDGFEKTDFQYSYADFATVRMKEEEPVSWGTISIPSNWEMQGFDAPSYTYNTYPWGQGLVAPNVSESYNPVGIYRNMVEVPADWSDRQVYVSFDGVASCIYVYVNGAMVGYAEDSYTGKTFNITEAVNFGEKNLVVFEVYKFCDGSYLEANDSIKFGGIYRDVYLYSAPNTQIRDFTYDMQMSGENALLNINVDIASYDDPSSDLQLYLSIYDKEGNCVYQPKELGTKVNFSEKTVSTANAYLGAVGGRVEVVAPKLWSAETPNLYTMVFELKNGDDVIDLVSKTVGFKTVGVSIDDDGNQTFMLNDKPLVLRGILYNENSPVTGMTVSTEELVSDIKLMKEMNINAVRSPGRPLSAEFISLCDEYGLYVIDDMSLNSNPYADKDESSIPGNQTVWQTACLDRLLNVVYRDKNSASVLMWSFGSNSGTGTAFSVLRGWLASADNRLIVYDDDSSASDLVVASNMSLNELVQLLGDKGNKKPVFVQDTRGALLNNGGNFSAYASLMEEYANLQGGFFAYWADNAIYWPTIDAAETLRNKPYNAENAGSYRLAYAGGWGDTTSATDGYMSLSGVLTADRKAQGDALELKNVYSPVYIVAEDAANGSFRVYNRNSFSSVGDLFEITYEATDGKNVIGSGSVTVPEIAGGESALVSLNLSDKAAYVYFTVKYKTAPSWMDANADLKVFEKQISLKDATVDKDGSVQAEGTGALNLSIFQAPEIYVSSYTFAKGQMYVTNRSQTNFNDLYTVSWVVYERHPLWSDPRWVVYDEGTMQNFNVPAGAVNHLVTIPVDTDGAVVDGSYAAHILLTTKVDIAGVPAGTVFSYALNPTGDGSNIPFKNNPARNPVEISFDEQKGESTFGPAPMDTEPEPSDDDLHEVPAVPASYSGPSLIVFKNNEVSLSINATTGLITEYSVGGKDIFVKSDSSDASMQSNLYRVPTGGDLTSSFVSTAMLNNLKNLSQNYTATKSLPNGYKVSRISDTHYRVELDYLWVSYPVNAMRTFSYDTEYTVVYDIYSSGEIQVSVKYDPSVKAVVPLELSSIMTLTADFTTMSWYGIGSGDSFSDKYANGRTGVYKDVAIVDQLGSEYIYSTGNGDKTDVRWMALEREDGSGILLTSDTDLFAVNVSKDYPWNSSAYPASKGVVSYKNTVVRVIGQQRGISANTLFDEEYSNAKYVVPGVSYSYSFRVVPVNSGYDADKISRTVASNAANLSAIENLVLNNKSFSLTNAAATDKVLSSLADGKVDISAALGNASQYWTKEAATDQTVSDAFRIKSAANGLYLSPVSRDQYGVLAKEVELTLAPYYNLAWQNWIYQDNQLFVTGYNSSGGYFSLYIGGSGNFNVTGARLALKAARSDAQSKWTVIPDVNDPNKIRIQSALSGKYLTLVDNMTYSNPLVEDYAFRMRNFSARINWNDYASLSRAVQYTAANRDQWVGDDYYVTQWDLLPADSQMWTFVPVNGGYLIVNKQTGAALTAQDGALVEAAVTNAPEQIWAVVANNGMYGLVNMANNQALTLRSVGGTNVLALQKWEGLAIQLWSLGSVEDYKVNIQAGSNWY